MKVTVGIAAVAFVVLPSLAAAGCGHDTQKQAMSCVEGSVYDSASKSCVPASG